MYVNHTGQVCGRFLDRSCSTPVTPDAISPPSLLTPPPTVSMQSEQGYYRTALACCRASSSLPQHQRQNSATHSQRRAHTHTHTIRCTNLCMGARRLLPLPLPLHLASSVFKLVCRALLFCFLFFFLFVSFFLFESIRSLQLRVDMMMAEFFKVRPTPEPTPQYLPLRCDGSINFPLCFGVI